MALFVTHVGVERGGNFLRIFGQVDKDEAIKIETTIKQIVTHQARRVTPDEVQVKLRCLTRYDDGSFYRAQILKILDKAKVSVLFIDYGNTAVVSVKELLSLHTQSPQALYLMGTPPQANEYILARITGSWTERQLNCIQEDICFESHHYNIEDKVDRIPLIGIIYKNVDYSQYLIERRKIGAFIAVKSQNDAIQVGKLLSPSPLPTAKTNPDKIDSLAGMKYLQSGSMMKKKVELKPTNPFLENIESAKPAKPSTGLRLQMPNMISPGGPQSGTEKIFKQLMLPTHSMYEVTCSFVEDGYKLFYIHLKQKERELSKLQADLAHLPLQPIQNQPKLGMACIARHETNSRLYRGIITSIKANQCVVSFVDYGFTHSISYGSLFEIPINLMRFKMFAVQCTLYQSEELDDSFTLKNYFQQLILNKDLHMKILSDCGPTFVQICEIYINSCNNVIDELKHIQMFGLQYQPALRLSADFKGPVIVRYVDSPQKFYVQLMANTSEYDVLMDKLSIYCQKKQDRQKENGDAKVGSLCAVPVDNKVDWYRGQVVEVNAAAKKASVRLVDFGKIINVPFADIREIGYQFTQLPPQVYECCIKGFENVTDITVSSADALEMLVETAMEERKTLMMHIIDFLTEETLLVNLFDESQMPPVNISKSLCKSQLPYKDYVNMFEKKQPGSIHKRESLEQPSTTIGGQSNYNATSSTKGVLADNRIVQYNNGNSTPERAFELTANTRGHPKDSDDRQNFKNSGGDKWNVNDNRGINNNIVGEKPQKRQFIENTKGFEKRDTQARDGKPNNDRVGERGSDRTNDRGGDRSPRKNIRGPTREIRPYQAQNNYADANGQDWNGSCAPQEPKTVESNISLSSTDFKAADVNFDPEYDVVFTYWMDPEEFYVQIQTHRSDYEAMLKDIQDFYGGKKSIGATHYENGWCVIARNSRDELLHRAKVCDYNKKLNKYKVLFVDRGYRGVVTSDLMWPITEAFLTLPAMAIRCSLANNVALDFDQQNIFNQIGKYVNDNMMIKCKFNDITDNVYAVTVTVECGNLLHAFVKDGLVKLPTEERSADVDIEIEPQMLAGQTIRVKLINIEGLDKFEVVLEHTDVKLPAMYFNENYAKVIDVNIADQMKSLEGTFCPVKVASVDSNNKLRLAILSDMFLEEPPLFCPLALYQTKFSVFVAFVESLNVIYIQMSKHSDALSKQLDEMWEFYEPSQSVIDPAGITLNTILAVKSVDENWYRGKVVGINGVDITVHYIDYGNKETVKVDSLRLLDEKFSGSSNYATRIFLPLECMAGSDEDSAVTELSKMILNIIPVLSILSEYRGEWIGEVSANDCSLAAELEKKGLAKASNTNKICQMIRKLDDLSVQENAANKEAAVSALVTHIVNPSKFYLQEMSIQDELAKLQDDVQIVGESLPLLTGGKFGDLCLAKYSIDGLWYRARILDSGDEVTALEYIDYGNTDIVTDSSFLREISEAFADIKPYARLCSLPLIPKGHQDDWSQAAVDIMQKLYQDQEITYTVISENNSNCYVHLQTEDGTNAEKLLLKKCLADPLSLIEPNSIGFVSHINSLEDFYMQMEKDTDDLEKISNSLFEISTTGANVTNMEEGKMYAALFPDDNCWYRAKLIHSTAEGLEVIFVDYGNTAITTSIKDLPSKFAELPILSKKCCLEPSPHAAAGKWPEEAQKKFVEIAKEGATCFAIVPLAPGETTTVRLFLEGENIVQILQRTEATEETQTSSQFEESTLESEPSGFEEIIATVSHINSLSDFYLHPSTNLDDLNRITDNLNTLACVPIQAKDINTICAATFSTDNCVYRAKVEAAEDENKYRVLFIDYGNTTVTSDVWELSQEMKTIDPLAISCSLVKFTPGDWSDEAVAKFREISGDGEVQFRVVFLDKTASPALVQLFLDGQEVSLGDNVPNNDQDFCEGASETISTESAAIEEETADADSDEISCGVVEPLKDEGNVSKNDQDLCKGASGTISKELSSIEEETADADNDEISLRVVEPLKDEIVETSTTVMEITDEIADRTIVHLEAHKICEEVVDLSISQCTEDFDKSAEISTPSTVKSDENNENVPMTENGNATSDDSGANSSHHGDPGSSEVPELPEI